MKCECDNCGWSGDHSKLDDCGDLAERLGCYAEESGGGITLLPIGECPECGALAYNEEQAKIWDAVQKVIWPDQKGALVKIADAAKPDDYRRELVDRCAPRWAWEVIDEALRRLGAINEVTEAALVAMVHACENPGD